MLRALDEEHGRTLGLLGQHHRDGRAPRLRRGELEGRVAAQRGTDLVELHRAAA
jgi:hypothetical protein